MEIAINVEHKLWFVVSVIKFVEKKDVFIEK